jgi:hypothetical protein
MPADGTGASAMTVNRRDGSPTVLGHVSGEHPPGREVQHGHSQPSYPGSGCPALAGLSNDLQLRVVTALAAADLLRYARGMGYADGGGLDAPTDMSVRDTERGQP